MGSTDSDTRVATTAAEATATAATATTGTSVGSLVDANGAAIEPMASVKMDGKV
jgi:hypothetical protein